MYHTIRFYVRILAIASVVASAFWVFSLFQANNYDVPLETLVATDIPYAQEEWIPALPVRLVIPAINVDAEVQYVGLATNGTGEMDVPSNFTDVAWYEHGVRPGMRGSAVIAGHYNGKSAPEAVFFDLHTLHTGDEVVIMNAEQIENIFHVVKIETYDYDAPTADVFLSSDGRARLNLITCGGEWLSEEKSYNKRTVVFTEQLTDVE